MPVDNIDRAIKRGTGEGTAGSLEEMTLEGYSPGGAAMLLKIVTDNRNRTVSEVRSIFTKNNASNKTHLPALTDMCSLPHLSLVLKCKKSLYP